MNMKDIIVYLKGHWQKSAIVGGLALVVLSMAVIFFLSTMRIRSIAQTPANTNSQEPISIKPAVRTYTDLFAVSIDNMVDARPASGINQAALVFETSVEGDITRLLAIFERGTEVKEIGPVRSARPYFLDFISELGPSLFLHFGGSPEALSLIASSVSLKQVDRDGMGNAASGFWRDDSRDMPHNAYTSSEKVEKMFATRGGEPRTVTAWLMAPEPDPALRGADDSFTVSLSGSANYRPEWRYESAKNVYVRYSRGKQELTRDGSAIEAKNVIVMQTDIKSTDAVGRLKITTAGQGHATVYRNGEKTEGTWNGTDGSITKFYGGDGNEVVLTEGNVWIEVIKK
jgi:hypothetical protein